jgi:hypothetical protein
MAQLASRQGGASTAGITIAVKVVATLVVAGAVAGGAVAYHAIRDNPSNNINGVGGTVALAADPGSLDFRVVFIGDKPNRTINVRNTGTAEVTPSAATVSGIGFALQSDNCATKSLVTYGTCTIVVVFQPAQKQKYVGQLNLHAGQSVVNVPLAGEGDLVDLAGSYTLRTLSADSSNTPDIVTEELSYIAHVWATDGLRITGNTATATAFIGKAKLLLKPTGDGALTCTTSIAGVKDLLVVRPQKIVKGKAATLIVVLTVQIDNPDRSVSSVTATYAGTRK